MYGLVNLGISLFGLGLAIYAWKFSRCAACKRPDSVMLIRNLALEEGAQVAYEMADKAEDPRSAMWFNAVAQQLRFRKTP